MNSHLINCSCKGMSMKSIKSACKNSWHTIIRALDVLDWQCAVLPCDKIQPHMILQILLSSALKSDLQGVQQNTFCYCFLNLSAFKKFRLGHFSNALFMYILKITISPFSVIRTKIMVKVNISCRG